MYNIHKRKQGENQNSTLTKNKLYTKDSNGRNEKLNICKTYRKYQNGRSKSVHTSNYFKFQ